MNKEEFDNFARKELERCNKQKIPTYISYSAYKVLEKENKQLKKKLEQERQKQCDVKAIIEYWGLTKEQNDCSAFRTALKEIDEILGDDK